MYKKFQLHQLVAEGYAIDEYTDLCHICMDLLISPIKCLNCGSKFCKSCADKWNKGSHRCPNKCSEKWEYSITPPLQVGLRCPFSCETIIFPDNFEDHIKACCKAPQKYKEQFFEEDMKMEYKCKKNHYLQYISCPEEIPCNIDCATCHKHQLTCRSICKECLNHHEGAFAYCTVCRFPKGLTKTKCPIGHTDFKVKASSSCQSSLCDVCANKPTIGGAACVCDQSCHLTVCMKCFLDLEDGDGIPTPSRSNSSRSPYESPSLSRNASHKSQTESDEQIKHKK